MPAGCACTGQTINHLMYADDLVVVAPSAKGLQNLLNTCSIFGENHDILYNCKKSQLMLFNTRLYGDSPDTILNNAPLKYVDQYKYLGYVIDNKLNDEYDMK